MLTAANEYRLMAGEPCAARIRGWVEDCQGPPADLVSLWAAHGERLIAAAAAFGFTPHAETGRAPKGGGFAAWRANFIQQHSY
jgi:hypothetical protein